MRYQGTKALTRTASQLWTPSLPQDLRNNDSAFSEGYNQQQLFGRPSIYYPYPRWGVHFGSGPRSWNGRTALHYKTFQLLPANCWYNISVSQLPSLPLQPSSCSPESAGQLPRRFKPPGPDTLLIAMALLDSSSACSGLFTAQHSRQTIVGRTVGQWLKQVNSNRL